MDSTLPLQPKLMTCNTSIKVGHNAHLRSAHAAGVKARAAATKAAAMAWGACCCLGAFAAEHCTLKLENFCGVKCVAGRATSTPGCLWRGRMALMPGEQFADTNTDRSGQMEYKSSTAFSFTTKKRWQAAEYNEKVCRGRFTARGPGPQNSFSECMNSACVIRGIHEVSLGLQTFGLIALCHMHKISLYCM